MIVERRTVRVWDTNKRDYVNVTVQVSVDINALAEEYAAKAMKNKSRKVRQCHGAVEVEAK